MDVAFCLAVAHHTGIETLTGYAPRLVAKFDKLSVNTLGILDDVAKNACGAIGTADTCVVFVEKKTPGTVEGRNVELLDWQ
jgi:hypothetical protein